MFILDTPHIHFRRTKGKITIIRKVTITIRHCSGTAKNWNNNPPTFVSDLDARHPNSFCYSAEQKKYKTIIRHCGSTAKKPKQQSTYLCKQSGCQTSWCPPWVLAHPHPGRITKTTISHGGKEINTNRNQSTYTAATTPGVPMPSAIIDITDAAIYCCKEEEKPEKKWWGKEREKQQLTCAAATCTNGVPMHCWCQATSCASMAPVMLPPTATGHLLMCCWHCLLLSWGCSHLLVLRHHQLCRGRRGAGEKGEAKKKIKTTNNLCKKSACATTATWYKPLQ